MPLKSINLSSIPADFSNVYLLINSDAQSARCLCHYLKVHLLGREIPISKLLLPCNNATNVEALVHEI